MNGIFTISLDFELHWGGFEKWPIQGRRYEVRGSNGEVNYDQCFLNTRKLIPEMLELLEKYQAHATWATVGMLFHESREALIENTPKDKPTYQMQVLSAYRYIENKGIGKDELVDPFHFAPSLVQQIIDTPFQELGSHTFAHYYCNEPGQNPEQFRDDLRAAQRAAKAFGFTLRSLVFPRNQFNEQYLKVCFQEGITSVRSNPLDWFWHIESTQSESVWKRLNRGLDAYLPIGKKNTYKLGSIPVHAGLPVCLPASRLLRPYNPKELFLNALKINCIKSEMTRAAALGEVYHLWWHPHNFGWYPEESMEGLRQILKRYKHCHDKYGMQSMNMGEMTEFILSQKRAVEST